MKNAMAGKLRSWAATGLAAALLLTGCGAAETAAESASATAQQAAQEVAETAQQAAETVAEEAAETAEEVVGAAAEAADDGVNTELSGSIVFVSNNDTTGGLDEMIAAFNEKYPNVTVDHQSIAGASDDVKQGLITALAAGDTDPDVFTCDIIWVSQFAAAGWLLDVTDDLAPIASNYLAGPLSTCYFGDRAYAYPDYTDVGLLYYRTDIIDTPPTTWEELEALSKEHAGEGGTDYGFVFQMFQGEPTSCNILEFIKQNGGHDLENGSFAFNNDRTREALAYVNELIDEGISPEGVLAHKPEDTREIFESGKAIFMRNWTYAIGTVDAETSSVAGNVGIAVLPVGPGGTESSGTLGGWNYSVNANTDEPEASKAFAEFMSSYEAQKIAVVTRGSVTSNALVYEDADILAVRPILTTVAAAAEAAKPRPQVRDYTTISTIIQEWIHKALTGEEDYDTALQKLDEEANEALAKMK